MIFTKQHNFSRDHFIINYSAVWRRRISTTHNATLSGNICSNSSSSNIIQDSMRVPDEDGEWLPNPEHRISMEHEGILSLITSEDVTTAANYQVRDPRQVPDKDVVVLSN